MHEALWAYLQTQGLGPIHYARLAYDMGMTVQACKKQFSSMADILLYLEDGLEIPDYTGSQDFGEYLFESLLGICDQLHDQKKLLRSLYEAALFAPTSWCDVRPALKQLSQRLTVHITPSLKKTVYARAVESLIVYTFHIWIQDESLDFGRTMAKLDQTLRWLHSMSAALKLA